MRFTGQDNRYGERYLECDSCGHAQTDKTDRKVKRIPCENCGMWGSKQEGESNV